MVVDNTTNLVLLSYLVTRFRTRLLATVALDSFVFGCAAAGLVLAGLFTSAVSHAAPPLSGSYSFASGWFAVGYSVGVGAAVTTGGFEVPGFGDAFGHVGVADFGEDVVVELGPGGPFGSTRALCPARP